MTTWVKELRLHTSNVHQQVVTDIHCLKLLEIMNDIYRCAFCKEAMAEDEYYFCDICPECRDDPNRSESYE